MDFSRFGYWVRAGLAVAGVWGLVACGGGGGGGGGAVQYTIGGSVTGLIGTLTLQNNGGNNLTVSADGSFSFATALNDQSGYSVTPSSQPAGQLCTITNGSGTLAGSAVSNIVVSCALNLAGELTGGLPRAVAIQGQYAYSAADAGLLIMDISNPVSPVKVAFYDTPGNAYDVAVSGDYAYVADESGLRIINISNPTVPVEAGFYDTLGPVYGIVVSVNYAYVTGGYSGLRIIDISNPASPVGVGFYDTAGFAWDVAVSGNYAYVADGNSGLRIINISDLAVPVEAGFYDTPGDARGVSVVGSYAYVSDGNSGLRISTSALLLHR